MNQRINPRIGSEWQRSAGDLLGGKPMAVFRGREGVKNMAALDSK